MRLKHLLAASMLLSVSCAQGKEIQIDLTKQMAYAVEDNKVVFEGHISSGTKGHETPNGEWEITEKKAKHISNLWPKPNGGARMPYMMRLGNTPMALHLGDLPGKPASKGCIRLEKGFAQKLFKWTPTGTIVKITGDSSDYNTTNAYISRLPKKNRIIHKPKKIRRDIHYYQFSDEVNIRHGVLGEALTVI